MSGYVRQIPGVIALQAREAHEVLHQMEDHRVKRLPVIENHRLIGMISEADLARHLDEHRLAEFVETRARRTICCGIGTLTRATGR
jgi:CBS-domain-containing membrane protein